MKSGSIILSCILCALFHVCESGKPTELAELTERYISLDSEEAFAHFEKRFRKKYDAASGERERRKQIFIANLKRYSAHNSDKRNSKIGVTRFADLTREERKKIARGHGGHGKHYANKTGLLWGKLPKRGTITYVNGTRLPKEINWIAEGAVTPVQNQGDCGSCWAFAATGALEGHLFRSTGKLTKLSEQDLLDCNQDSLNVRCDGGFAAHAFEFVQHYGLYAEEDYPYKCADHSSAECLEAKCLDFDPFRLAVQPDQVTGYFDIERKMTSLMRALTYGPVSVAIEADCDEFMENSGEVLVSPKCGHNLDHAVLAVGYGAEEDGTKYWLVKNSWGTDWGYYGYIKIGRGLRETEGGECGILAEASMPEVATESRLQSQRMTTIVV